MFLTYPKNTSREIVGICDGLQHVYIFYCTMTTIILRMVAEPPTESLCVSYECDRATSFSQQR